MADILIRGVPMPVPDFHTTVIIMGNGDVFWYDEKVGTAVPLPEGHGRLGDLDKINASLEAMIEIEHNQKAAPHSWSHAYMEMQSILDDAPTIIEADLEWKMKNCCCFSNTDRAEGGTDNGN